MAGLTKWDRTISSLGVNGNKIELFDVSSKMSFVFSLDYSSNRKGMYFYNGNGLVVLAAPFNIASYFDIICEDGKIWAEEKSEVSYVLSLKTLP